MVYDNTGNCVFDAMGDAECIKNGVFSIGYTQVGDGPRVYRYETAPMEPAHKSALDEIRRNGGTLQAEYRTAGMIPGQDKVLHRMAMYALGKDGTWYILLSNTPHVLNASDIDLPDDLDDTVKGL